MSQKILVKLAQGY